MENKNEKLKFSEKIKDKRERAKIELICYGIFFIIIILMARFMGGNTSAPKDDGSLESLSFVYDIEDNYEYDMVISIDDYIYEYYGKVLGNNMTINLVDDEVKSYRLIGNKYYVLEDGNYILSNEDEIYPYIDYRYLDINNIREYMELSSIDGNSYRVNLSDIVLDSDTLEYLEIVVDEGDLNISIDYSPLLRLTEKTEEKVMVSITYSNIDKIISLDE